MGFEVELADRIAAHLGVRAEFRQGDWDTMPDLLKAQKVDVILNGYEWTPARAELMEASIPYYVYGLQLLARKDDASIGSWKDLAARSPSGAKRRVGVLAGSAADDYATAALREGAVEVVRYDGSTDSMRETETGKLDACVQDTPIAVWYAARFPALRAVDAPVAEGYYVLYARKGDTELVRAVDEAIVALLRSGELRRLYEKYGIWDARQERLFQIAEAGRFFGVGAGVEKASGGDGGGGGGGTAGTGAGTERVSAPRHGLAVVRDYGEVMVESAGMTVVLAVLSFPCALLVGLVVAIGRVYGGSWLRRALTFYVEFLRGTPLMLQLYFIFFFLPELHVRIPAFATGVVGLAVNYSAYESEVYRAGLQAIPPGQLEAALSLGMTRSLAIRRIVVPQAARIVIPPVVNDFISLFKDTSVCSVVTIMELTKRYSVLSMSTQATVELMVMTAVLYLAMSYPLSMLAARLEARLGHGQEPQYAA